MKLALYIHVPFCLEKCPYCDFHSIAVDRPAVPQQTYADCVLRQLEREVGRLQLQGRSLVSCFFGGGTPSLMDQEFFDRVLNCLPKYFSVDAACEITVETNPATADCEKFKQWLPAGINRISFGMQSFHPHLLQRLGRFHTAKEGFAAMSKAREAGFTNINTDIIFGIEGQTLQELESDLVTAMNLQPTHISAYQLTVEAGTPLANWVQSGKIVLPPEENIIAMHHLTAKLLEAGGFRRYEISNYAQPNFEARHNLQYWECGDSLGIGSGAVSFVAGKRWRTTRKLKNYLAGDFIPDEEETLSLKTAMGEYCMMGLRLMCGIDRNDFANRFGQSMEAVWPGLFARLQSKGWLQNREDRVALTPEGLMFANIVAIEFL